MTACSFQFSKKLPTSPLFGGGSSKSPSLLKNFKVSPLFSHFTDQRRELSRASEGWASQGKDGGMRFPAKACSSGSCSGLLPGQLGPPLTKHPRSDLCRSSHKTHSAFSSPRWSCLCVAEPFTPEKPHGQQCLFICSDQRESCLMQRQAPFWLIYVFKIQIQNSPLGSPVP